MALWRKWQTHLTKDQVPKGVGVRFSSEPPRMRIEEYAYSLGYRISKDGIVYFGSAKVKTFLKSKDSNCGYLVFYVKQENGKLQRCKVHRLQAFQKFGNALYNTDIMVRHLNGDKLDNSFRDILLGNNSQNQNDITPEKRLSRARNAAKYLPNRYDKDVILSIKRDRENGFSYSELMRKYDIKSKGTMSYICNHEYCF